MDVLHFEMLPDYKLVQLVQIYLLVFENQNILEQKLWLHGDVTTETTCFTRSLWIRSFISRVSFWEKGRGMGGWICLGCAQNSILYHWMVFKTQGSDVTFIQFEAARCRRPAGQLLSSEVRGERFCWTYCSAVGVGVQCALSFIKFSTYNTFVQFQKQCPFWGV